MTFPSLRGAGRIVPLLCALGVAACEFPSEPPIFEQTWIVPADSVEIDISSFLPDSVAFSSDSSAFVLTTEAATFDVTLGQLCGQPECQNPALVTIPNTPAFSYTGTELNSTVDFPGGVQSITVTGGTLRVQVVNNLGFDPLRPNGGTGPYGNVTIVLASGAIVSNYSITGSVSQGIPTGQTTTFNLPLPAGVYADTLDVDVSVTAPAGGSATVASGNTLSVDASLQNLLVSSAVVVVDGDSVTTNPREFDLEDVDVGDAVQGGGLQLEIVNPLTAQANIKLVLAAPLDGIDPAVNIEKDVVVAPSATSTVDLVLTKTELESLLGRSGVTVNVRGTAAGTGGGAAKLVTVTPTAVIRVRTKLSVTVQIGGDL